MKSIRHRSYEMKRTHNKSEDKTRQDTRLLNGVYSEVDYHLCSIISRNRTELVIGISSMIGI